MLKGEHRILGIRSPGDVCRGRGKPGILTGPGRPRGADPGMAVTSWPLHLGRGVLQADTGGAAPCGCPALVVSFQVDQSYIKPTFPKPRKEHPHV
ncbi:uncharacterized protein AruCF_5210 [Achromobacter ruhlandii]|nr:uncharacterized protein AruCF_5210 [Achromobacter ruhlandii]